MIDYIIIFSVIVLILGITYYFCTKDSYIVRVNRNQVIDFKTSMDLTGLPIVVFYQGQNKFNFLLDTGSNASYVNHTSNLAVEKTGKKDVFMGAEGKDMNCEYVVAKLFRNKKEYDCTIAIADLDAAFTELKNIYGVTLSGILGNDFLTKYKYCLDFKELVAYVRK